VLESIFKIIPTEDEEMTVKSYDGDIEDLGKP
jgi:hypothetical protein